MALKHSGIRKVDLYECGDYIVEIYDEPYFENQLFEAWIYEKNCGFKQFIKANVQGNPNVQTIEDFVEDIGTHIYEYISEYERNWGL